MRGTGSERTYYYEAPPVPLPATHDKENFSTCPTICGGEVSTSLVGADVTALRLSRPRSCRAV